jgi:hypothetical protein
VSLVHKIETGVNVFEIRFGINIIFTTRRERKAIEVYQEINIKKIKQKLKVMKLEINKQKTVVEIELPVYRKAICHYYKVYSDENCIQVSGPSKTI